jgi:hypothetical protein
MQSVQSYKRRTVSERSRVEKETVSKRSSPVKQPRLKQAAVIKEERWTSGVASSQKEDIPARSVISAKWYNCYKCYNCW